MTARETRTLFKLISPSPGFILNLTKSELSDLVYDITSLELEDYSYNGNSNAKRLQTLLESEPTEVTEPLVTELITRNTNDT